jgi:hypothetical protein
MSITLIIEEGYLLFSEYTISGSLDVCKVCCVSDEEERLLVSTPLRKISKNVMGYYYNSARCESEKELLEMKHFLPRVLELLSVFEIPCHSAEILMQPLRMRETAYWPAEETELLQRFSETFFADCLERYPLPGMAGIDEYIVMFGLAPLNLKGILNTWLHTDSINSLLHLNELMMQGMIYDGYTPYKLNNSFKDVYSDNTVTEWLRSAEVKGHFAAAAEKLILSGAAGENEAELSILYELLTH